MSERAITAVEALRAWCGAVDVRCERQGGKAPASYRVEFQRSGGFTVALIHVYDSNAEREVTHAGAAKLHPGDADNPVRGRALALQRATDAYLRSQLARVTADVPAVKPRVASQGI